MANTGELKELQRGSQITAVDWNIIVNTIKMIVHQSMGGIAGGGVADSTGTYFSSGRPMKYRRFLAQIDDSDDLDTVKGTHKFAFTQISIARDSQNELDPDLFFSGTLDKGWAINLAERRATGQSLLSATDTGRIVEMTVMIPDDAEDGTPDDDYFFYFTDFGGNNSKSRRFVMITGSSLVSGQLARWKYTAVDVSDFWTLDGVPQTPPPGTTISNIYNMLEGNNPASGIGQMMSGPYISSADYANGQKLQPLVTGAVYELIEQLTCASSGTGSGAGSGGSGTVQTMLFVIGVNVKKECPDGSGG